MERKKRYEEKIDFALQSLETFSEWIEQAEHSELHLFASAKAFQECIEAITDIISMLCTDLFNSSKDDYSNIELLFMKGILSKEEAALLKEANGLRNVVVHKYNSYDEERFIKSSKEMKTKLENLLEKIAQIVEEKIK